MHNDFLSELMDEHFNYQRTPILAKKIPPKGGMSTLEYISSKLN